jgi:hypothetical protein
LYRGQLDDAAQARVQALRDPLDDAALARRVAPLEEDHDLQLLRDHPVLQLHELALQAKEGVEILAPVHPRPVRVIGDLADQLMKAVVVHLHLQLLVEAVEELVVQAAPERADVGLFPSAHVSLRRSAIVVVSHGGPPDLRKSP